ncbi:MAG TPA: putative transporter [Deltaproteobacteria bacterium]|nr:putative transporter [Deltaproteobacteria bacterium]
MPWFQQLLFDSHAIASGLFLLSFTIATGLALGALRLRSIRLGVAGVLFSGLLIGHLGFAPDPTVVDFAREFGLILFVYTVGLAVGPGFFNALRTQGLRSNLIALGVVLGGLGLTVASIELGGISPAVAVGLFSGGTTNTPSLAAATQALEESTLSHDAMQRALTEAGVSLGPVAPEQMHEEVAKLPGVGYAVSYPFGIIGIILLFAALPRLFRLDPVQEGEAIERLIKQSTPPLERVAIRVAKRELHDVELGQIPGAPWGSVVVSRIVRGREQFVGQAGFRLAYDDVLLAVGPAAELERLTINVGERADIDPLELPSTLMHRWVLVSRKSWVRRGLAELDLLGRYGVQLTRVRRAEVEMQPRADLRLALGDRLRVVGTPEAVAAVAAETGDSPRALEEPELIAVFSGIALGVVIGSCPISLPGIPAPVKLGLAGGPLLVALLLARVQRIGPLVFYLPRSASMALRDTGVAIFLASVGLKSGDRFLAALTQGQGVWWMVWGAAITLLPLLLVALVAYLRLGLPYATLLGVLAGSMTDPPALAFANAQTRSEAPSLPYATVYPLTMILRVVLAQVMILTWA